MIYWTKRKLQKLIRWLYVKAVNDIYLPEDTRAFVKFQDGRLHCIRLLTFKSKYRKFEAFVFNVQNKNYGYDNINLVRTKLTLEKT